MPHDDYAAAPTAAAAAAGNRAAAAEDVLVAGRVRERSAGASAFAVLLTAVVALAWIVVAERPVTIAGHGSRALPPPHAQYQPYLGRPVF